MLVVLSLGLLTAYFGESVDGGLHSFQRGVTGVLSPVQDGASRALKPARDFFGWFGDTLRAKEERDELKAERDRLRREVAALELHRRDNEQLRSMLEFNASMGIERFQPVKGRVIARSPNVWYSTLQINQGSSDGLQRGQPVVNGEGLVGKIKAVSSGSAWVTLITDQEFGVSALAPESGEPGTISPAVGSPGTLLFELVPHGKLVHKGDRIVTAGTAADAQDLPSLFPRGIPIGTVKRVVDGDGQLDRRIQVAPAVDLRRVEFVEVLTMPHSDVRASVSP
ncbi:MAG: rod shape-determining protein MreC [Actinomycetota bacterium]|nr:rod shape-determining protein MreC [Actinomycetota bacterium]